MIVCATMRDHFGPLHGREIDLRVRIDTAARETTIYMSTGGVHACCVADGDTSGMQPRMVEMHAACGFALLERRLGLPVHAQGRTELALEAHKAARIVDMIGEQLAKGEKPS